MSKLIVLEGLDGAGTTSQAKRLAEALRNRGVANLVTRQPSDGPVGTLLRQMLTGQHMMANGQAPSQDMFGLLFAADRMDHIEREVEPALAAGRVVISDRWYHSSFAYQAGADDRAWLAVLNQKARVPDLTIFLRVAPEVAAHRRMLAGRVQELFEDVPMQRRVAAGYDQVNAQLSDTERIEILDGEQTIEQVWQAIWALAEQLLHLRA
jgi:dTMP kinase